MSLAQRRWSGAMKDCAARGFVCKVKDRPVNSFNRGGMLYMDCWGIDTNTGNSEPRLSRCRKLFLWLAWRLSHLHSGWLHTSVLWAAHNLGVVLESPSPVGAMNFSVPISAQKSCEHFQKCAISLVNDRLQTS
jgi:hypothetical protein